MTFSKYVGFEQRQIRSKITRLVQDRLQAERTYRRWLDKRDKYLRLRLDAWEHKRTILDMRIVALQHLLEKKMAQNGVNTKRCIPNFS